MDHAEALRSKAAERYLLGEMTVGDREEYEEHFFGCLDCAQEVEAGAAFIDSARDTLVSSRVRPIPEQSKVSSGWNWLLRPAFALPALALLLLIVGYQAAYVIPHIKSDLSAATAPQTLPSLSLLSANSRGGQAPEITIPANKPFGMFVDIPPGQKFSRYGCEVESASGAVEFSVNVSAEEAKQTVLLMVPPSKLTAGKYVLVVRGYDPSQPGSERETARYPFTLNISQ
jgi:hypothetical protein